MLEKHDQLLVPILHFVLGRGASDMDVQQLLVVDILLGELEDRISKFEDALPPLEVFI